MKKVLALVLAILLALSLLGCGSSKAEGTPQTQSAPAAQEAPKQDAPAVKEEDAPQIQSAPVVENTPNPDDLIIDPEWDSLNALGRIEMEAGQTFVHLTIPAEFSEGATQEAIDASAGTEYVSAHLNEDGSVTYKLTKQQHKNLLVSMKEIIDDAMQEICDTPEVGVARIETDANYRVFSVYLTTEEPSPFQPQLTTFCATMGGLYNIFSGHENDQLTFNYYSAGGSLISTDVYPS